MIAAGVALTLMVVAHRFRPRPLPRTSEPGAGRSIGARSIARLTSAALGAADARRTRRIGLSPALVADWCGELARAVRAGDTLRHALTHTVPANAPLHAATEPLRLALTRNRSIDESTGRTAGQTPAPGRRGQPDHLGLALSVVAGCGRAGGSAAAPLDRVAAALRQRAADDQERAAQAAQARLSAHVLTLIPIAVLGVLMLADDGVRGAVMSPIGGVCVTVGAALNITGWLWMGRIVRRGGR